MPDSDLDGANTIYQFDLIGQTYVNNSKLNNSKLNNSKLNISTDSGSGACNITIADQFLGVVLDLQSTDF